MKPPFTPDEALRRWALCLRDLLESADGPTSVTLSFPGGLELVYDVDDGCHLLVPGEPPRDLTEWVDWVGLVPA